jgi:hypothetical protein
MNQAARHKTGKLMDLEILAFEHAIEFGWLDK